MTAGSDRDDLDAEIAEAVARRRAELLAVTDETAPKAAEALVDTVLAGHPARRGSREWRLEVCVIAAHMLPKYRRDLGAEHPLVREWERIQEDLSGALFKDNVDRVLNL